MFADNKRLSAAAGESKRLAGLVQKYVKLELVDKLARLLTLIVTGFIALFIGFVVLICLALCLAAWLKSKTGDEVLSYGLVAVIIIILVAIALTLRRALIIRPIVKSLMKIFFDGKNHVTKP